MDLTFKTPEGRFNYRVCAVMLDGQRILAMHDARSPYYYLPGGRVLLGETAEQAVLREVREELGVDARIERPLWLCQSFFTEDVNGERYHELCLYFLMDISGTDLLARGDVFERYEKGRPEARRRQRFAWLPFERLQEEYFYPTFLKQDIFRLPEQLTLKTECE